MVPKRPAESDNPAIMKINIEVDEDLVADALRATGLETTDKVVELALKLLIQIKQQEAIRALRGQLPWDGDLNAMRTDR
jgi:Arc/MetJ family transcription regulator